MKEQLQTRHISDIDIGSIRNRERHKALLAMRATQLCVENEPGFEQVHEELTVHAGPGVPSTVTYEDIVLENGEPYYAVFSREPAVAQAEADFYRAHRDIENYLGRSVRALATGVLQRHFSDTNADRIEFTRLVGDSVPCYRSRTPVRHGTAETYSRPPANGAAAALLAEMPHDLLSINLSPDLVTPDPVGPLKLVNETIKMLHGQLDPNEFAAFRPYFVGLNGYPGASGLFTAGVPILDLLVHGGENISLEQREQMIRTLNKGLYPAKTRQFIGAKLLGRLLKSEQPRLDLPAGQGAQITEELNRFRRIHRATVKRHVPGALQGAAEGTGGINDVSAFLRSKEVGDRS